MSDKTPFQDVDAIAITKAFAQKNGLKSLEDLKKLAKLQARRAAGVQERASTGLKGMEQEYGIDNAKFKQRATRPRSTRRSTRATSTAANMFSTDAQLASGKYTVLKDPKGVFGFQNVLLRDQQGEVRRARRAPQFMDVINSVNKLLTAEAMQSMNSAVDIDKKDPAEVAGAFLDANKLT